MSKKMRVIDVDGENFAEWQCPVCKTAHAVRIGTYSAEDVQEEVDGKIESKAFNPVWNYNEDDEAPTLKPNVVIDTADGGKCSSLIVKGKVKFLAGSTHKQFGVFELPLIEGDSDEA